MKVIFMPNNTASLASVHIKKLKKLGVDAVGYNLAPRKHASLDEVKSFPVEGFVSKLRFASDFFKDLMAADVIHWMYGGESLPTKALLFFVRFLNKKKFVEYCGSDIRSIEMLCEDVDGYTVEQFIAEGLESLGTLEKSLKTQNRFKKAGFVPLISYPELIEYIQPEIHPKHHLISRSVDLEKLQVAGDFSNHVPLVVHGPSNPKVKGTAFIIDALKKLEEEGKLKYKLLQNMTHAQLLKSLKEADIVIDQIVAGDYGVFAIEAMAMSKPVFCFIRPKVLKHYQTKYEGFPIVNVDRHNLYSILNDFCVDRREELEALGRQGKVFAEKYHDSSRNAEKLLAIYEGLEL